MNDRATRVLVLYEGTRNGRAALHHAYALARERELPLTVLATEPTESLEKGCLRCRPATARWNEALCEIAGEELDDARLVLGDAEGVEYMSRRGRPSEAIARAAECGTGMVVVVVAGRRGPRLRRPVRLRAAACELVVAPPA